MTFCTLWPGLFLVAHVDYVRSVAVWPLGPERIRLEVSWMIDAGTLAGRQVDVESLTAFARRVVMEDAAICEVNQRGLRSARHEAGVLMPQEYGVLAFRSRRPVSWVLDAYSVCSFARSRPRRARFDNSHAVFMANE